MLQLDHAEHPVLVQHGQFGRVAVEEEPARLEAMAQAVEAVAALPDPLGRVLASWTQPNGLFFERVATPLGVIGIIFESRPNVTADAGALCLKSGNAALLRSGSESYLTAQAIAEAMRAGVEKAGLPADCIQLIPTKDRAAVGLMLTGLDGQIDVIVPRGGRSLVERVQTIVLVLTLMQDRSSMICWMRDVSCAGMRRSVRWTSGSSGPLSAITSPNISTRSCRLRWLTGSRGHWLISPIMAPTTPMPL